MIAKLRVLAKKTKTKLDDIIIEAIYNIKYPLYIFSALYVAIQFIKVIPILNSFVYFLFLFFIVFYAVKISQLSIRYLIMISAEKKAKEEGVTNKTVDKGFLKIISDLVAVSIWIVAILFLLSNLGVNITTFIASLGIGGIAIAFALQGVLTDLFASFSIYLDKPFKEGDYIVIGEDSGVVDKIGLKSTRIKTLQGQELVISNKELTEIRINNFKKLKKRRVVFKLGVTYETPNTNLNKIPGMIEKIVNAIKRAEFDRCHFKSFDDFCLTFEIVYFVDKGDYADYVKVEHELNTKIKLAFEKAKIDFAYPTQQIYFKKN